MLRHQFFDESDYLNMYPDIADAVDTGKIPDGLYHYNRYGRDEGRNAFKFDEDWYRRSYPLAVQEVESGKYPSLKAHFESIGRFRGYIAHAKAERPDNPNAIPSRFGGLWVDQANARDIVAGRLEIGLITSRQAELLQFFIDHGYVILEKAIPEELIERALSDHDAAYAGKFEKLLFECTKYGQGALPFRPEYVDHPSKALDLHWFSAAIRDLIFAPQVVEFLGLVLDAPPFASQSLCFHRGSAQEAHQDSAYVTYTLQRSFAASWIALEDVEAGAGELFYLDGSHRLDEFLYGNQCKSYAEVTRRKIMPEGEAQAEIRRHVATLPKGAADNGMPEKKFIAKRGDVLIWHADLAHGGSPISQTRSRRSVVTHYCGKYAAPLFAEWLSTSLQTHKQGLHTTSYYLQEPCV
jgi:hypothetical protein